MIDVSAIVSLLWRVVSRHGDHGDLAAAEIDAMMNQASPLDLARADGIVRRKSDWQLPDNDTDLIRRLAPFTGALGFISFHPSGYVRENVVNRLVKVRDGRELPFLLMRLNDWVPQVRAIARAAVLERIKPGYAAHFIHCLPLVDLLKQQQRQDHQPIVTTIQALLRSAPARPAVLASLESADRRLRRIILRLLAENPSFEALAVLHRALDDGDSVVRYWAARELRRHLDGPALTETLTKISNDRFMPVRREALYAFVEKLPHLAPVALRQALLDPHASVRETARFHLTQIGERRLDSFYRDKLDRAEPRQLATLIAGLGETGNREDAAKLLPFLQHPHPRIRFAALRAIARLDLEGASSHIVLALQDPSPSVAKAARHLLQRHTYLLSAAILWGMHQATPHAHVRQVTLSLIALLRWWQAAPLLLEAAATADEENRPMALDHLRQSCAAIGNPIPRPQGDDLKNLSEALASHGWVLDHSLLGSFDWVLSGVEGGYMA